MYPKRNVVNGSLPEKQLLTPTTATLNLNMSSQNTAYSMTDSMVLFVNGLFSPNFIPADTSTPYIPPSARLTPSVSTATPTAAGFVLPGISFGIVPIGFYMFSAYWVLFSAILVWGAWNKRKVKHPWTPGFVSLTRTNFQYRDAFRRRRAAVLNFTAGKRVYS